jgi:hypothetical protein
MGGHDSGRTTTRANKTALAIDPGATCGWAFWTTSCYKVGQVPISELWKTLDDIAFATGFGDFIIEDWDGREESNADIVPAKAIGIAEEWRRQRHPSVRVHRQFAHQAKFFFNDDKLKRSGLWVRGLRHGMDALKHLMYWQDNFVMEGSLCS